MPIRRHLPIFAAAFLALVAPAFARAAPADPAAARIEAFDRALVDTMKAGPALGPAGRYRKLAPAVEGAFDLPVMTRFAVGPAWATMSEADRQALIGAFTRLTVASYAHNFDRFGGEKFDIDPAVQSRGADKIVRCRLTTSDGKTVNLLYRMHAAAGGWKIVDVYYGAVSQLTTRRADFAAPLASGGAKSLIAHLAATSAKLLQ
ncbi:MAG: ABC transporter substrate-binding protein [Caulobacteraceae bacterium]